MEKLFTARDRRPRIRAHPQVSPAADFFETALTVTENLAAPLFIHVHERAESDWPSTANAQRTGMKMQVTVFVALAGLI